MKNIKTITIYILLVLLAIFVFCIVVNEVKASTHINTVYSNENGEWYKELERTELPVLLAEQEADSTQVNYSFSIDLHYDGTDSQAKRSYLSFPNTNFSYICDNYASVKIELCLYVDSAMGMMDFYLTYYNHKPLWEDLHEWYIDYFTIPSYELIPYQSSGWCNITIDWFNDSYETNGLLFGILLKDDLDKQDPGIGDWRITFKGLSDSVRKPRLKITYSDVEPLGAVPFKSDTYLPCWRLVSLPKNETIHKYSIFIRTNSYNYTWLQAVTEDIIVNFLANWTGLYYTVTDYFIGYEGFWMYFYNSSYHLWINSTILGFLCGNTSLTVINNTNNVTGNYTTSYNYTTGNTITLNFNGNVSSNISFDCNTSENWLWVADLTINNNQFFLLLFIGLWLMFLFKYIDNRKEYEENRGLLWVQFSLSLPTSIFIGLTSFIMSVPFGYIFAFIPPVISVYYLYDMFRSKKE